jgi:hypothetical protein
VKTVVLPLAGGLALARRVGDALEVGDAAETLADGDAVELDLSLLPHAASVEDNMIIVQRVNTDRYRTLNLSMPATVRSRATDRVQVCHIRGLASQLSVRRRSNIAAEGYRHAPSLLHS